jgi:hypothetical protein
MQKVNVSHGQTKLDKMVRRRDLPCVRRLWLLYRDRVACSVVHVSMRRRKKSDQEAKKKQRNGIDKLGIFVARSGVWNPVVGAATFLWRRSNSGVTECKFHAWTGCHKASIKSKKAEYESMLFIMCGSLNEEMKKKSKVWYSKAG